jgi:hypothetical protein
MVTATGILLTPLSVPLPSLPLLAFPQQYALPVVVVSAQVWENPVAIAENVTLVGMVTATGELLTTDTAVPFPSCP